MMADPLPSEEEGESASSREEVPRLDRTAALARAWGDDLAFVPGAGAWVTGLAVESAWWCSSASFRWVELLQEQHDAIAAGAMFEQRCELCLQELQAVCSAALSADEFRVAPFDWTPDVRLEAFGSTKQSLALQTSDLDIRMTFEQFEVRDKDRQLKYLRGIRANPGLRFKVLNLIEDARVPLLRLLFDGTLHVDLSMGGAMGGISDGFEDSAGVDPVLVALLGSALDAEAAMRFVRLVKAFVKKRSLVDAHGGLPSSTCWVCLAIAFLQSQKCLLRGSEVVAAAGEASPPSSCVGGVGAGAANSFSQLDGRCSSLWPVVLTPGLFCSFILFIERIGRCPFRVSLREGRCHPAKARTWSGARAPPLFLESPIEGRGGDNIARGLTWIGWNKVIDECTIAKCDFLPPKASAAAALQLELTERAVKRLFGDAEAPEAQEEEAAKRPRTGEV